jgi:hypothetical protein
VVSEPTADDPHGLRPDPASFAEAMEKMIDARIEQRLRGRALKEMDGVPDMVMVHELIARGWAVFRPSTQGNI